MKVFPYQNRRKQDNIQNIPVEYVPKCDKNNNRRIYGSLELEGGGRYFSGNSVISRGNGSSDKNRGYVTKHKQRQQYTMLGNLVSCF